MKKIYLTLFALSILNNSFGQVTFGVKGGANLSNVKMDASVDKKAIPGFHVGGMLHAGLTEKVFIQPELLFSTKGFEAPSIYFAENEQVRLKYISLPLLFGYYLAKGFTVSFGPEFGFLTSQTQQYNQFDVGLDASVAFKPFKNIGLDVRYNHGLRNIGNVLVRDRDNNTTYDAKTTHRVLQLSLFYQFIQ